jgi:hypothetical protein
MTQQMESIVQTIAHFKEVMTTRMLEHVEEPREIIDEEAFCTILAGIPSFRVLPGVPEHMGFEGIYHCATEEQADELKAYLKDVLDITDIDSLIRQSHEFFHFFNEYFDFANEWDGHPNFSLDELDADGVAAYTASRDFSVQLRDLVGPQGYLTWDIGERIMLARAACACNIISEDDFRGFIADQGRIANDIFDNFVDYAVSALTGAVYFMFVTTGRTEDDGLLGFLDINLKIVTNLFDSGIWAVNAWCEKNYKQLAIRDDQIQDLVPEPWNTQTGIATDRILCDGYRVSIMLREEALGATDSGWRFFAGDEPEEYISDSANFGNVSLNLIANYAPDIVPLLDAPVGSFFARNDDGELVQVSDEDNPFNNG